MRVEEHIHKAERLSASMAKCSREDYEALIEGAMLAATHWFNAALHLVRIRAQDNDTMHGTKLTVEEHKRCEALLPTVLEALEVIEELRSPYVRGAEPDGVQAGQLAMEKLGVIILEVKRMR